MERAHRLEQKKLVNGPRLALSPNHRAARLPEERTSAWGHRGVERLPTLWEHGGTLKHMSSCSRWRTCHVTVIRAPCSAVKGTGADQWIQFDCHLLNVILILIIIHIQIHIIIVIIIIGEQNREQLVLTVLSAHIMLQAKKDIFEHALYERSECE